MTIGEAFENWMNNPTPRTQAVLMEQMRNLGDSLDNIGVHPQWHEGLHVNCHKELVELMNFLRGEHVRFAAA